MKNALTFLPLLLLASVLFAQRYTGVTKVPDTSFTNHSAYLNTVKQHPGIKIVAELKSPLVKEKKSVTYQVLGKQILLLDIFQPAQNTNRAAVIIIHGGGWRSGSRMQHYPLAQHLAALGYTCFTPEYRLSTEALFPAAVYDIKAAIRWVRSNAAKYNVDTGKIAVLGFSAGGELAAFMGTTGNMPLFEGLQGRPAIGSQVNAVVDIDGILAFIHPESGEGDDSKRTSAATYWFGYSKEENPMLWNAASPLGYAGARTPPTLFLNSSVARMHAGRDDYIRILSANNIYSEVHTFDGAPHAFCLFEPWFTPTVSYVDGFLKKVFKPE
jgi:acetyl esterase/lipase